MSLQIYVNTLTNRYIFAYIKKRLGFTLVATIKYLNVCMQLVILIYFILESLTVTQNFKTKCLTSGNYQIIGAVGSSIVRGLASWTINAFKIRNT